MNCLPRSPIAMIVVRGINVGHAGYLSTGLVLTELVPRPREQGFLSTYFVAGDEVVLRDEVFSVEF